MMALPPYPKNGNKSKNEEEWKSEIRLQMEEELNKRVRDALETPPLERLRRRQQNMKSDENCTDPNAHLDLTEKEKEYILGRRRQRGFKPTHRSGSEFDLSRAESTYRQYLAERANLSAASVRDEERTYSGSGYVQVQRPVYIQELGHFRSGHGYESEIVFQSKQSKPAYPDGAAPIIPHPIIKDIICSNIEPLYSSMPVTNLPMIKNRSKEKVSGATTFDNQVTRYTHKWRGICIVFDSEKTPKEQCLDPPKNPLLAPNLIFESRFESGNLRQARRVGQFEYELVLKTDVFTKRHTQWYYFRIQNMVPGVIYKFRIVNLLKKDSLYNHGMRPLFYSERNANEKNIGWIRHGHHISYGRNIQHLQCPLMSREMPYYEMEWQMEFPHNSDTVYLAHCYPFTYTDLKNDLDKLLHDPRRSLYLKREVLCETKAGNSCFLLTITNFDEKNPKQAVVVSARVHPGESNSSWMMKGLYDFLTSDNQEAKELRNRFVFKIVPMLNPDGVIVGNYRCSLQARDLNRNYRRPRRDNFPTVFHVKKLVDDLRNSQEILVYCDFHGHSRKANVFMYGCNSNESQSGNVKAFLDERMLPFLMAQVGNGLFSFESSKFQIKKCKESTGRVVMYRQHNIKNSFTMEATFSGTRIDQNGARHFNQKDFMEAGKVFGLGVLKYAQVMEDKQRESETVVDLTKEITQQIMHINGIELPNDADYETVDLEKVLSTGTPGKTKSDANSESKATILKAIDNISEHTINKCVELLQKLSVDGKALESDSSDSDSESEPEMLEKKHMKKKKRSKRKKDRKQVKSLHYSADKPRSNAQEKHVLRRSLSQQPPDIDDRASKHTYQAAMMPFDDMPRHQFHNLRALPAIPAAAGQFEHQQDNQGEHRLGHNNSKSSNETRATSKAQWTNPYQGRSNGGIPCYSEERSLERASKRMAELQQRMEEKSLRRRLGWPENVDSELENELYYQELFALHMQKRQQQTEDSLSKSIRLLTQASTPKMGYQHGDSTPHREFEAGMLNIRRRPIGSSNIGKLNKLYCDLLHANYVYALADIHNPYGHELCPRVMKLTPLELSASNNDKSALQSETKSDVSGNGQCGSDSSGRRQNHRQWHIGQSAEFALELSQGSDDSTKTGRHTSLDLSGLDHENNYYNMVKPGGNIDSPNRVATNRLNQSHSHRVTLMSKDYSELLAKRLRANQPFQVTKAQQKSSLQTALKVNPLHQNGLE